VAARSERAGRIRQHLGTNEDGYRED